MLVRKQEPDAMELVLLNASPQSIRGVALLVGPEAVFPHETQRRLFARGRIVHRYSAAVRCGTLRARSDGIGAAQGAPRRRLTSTSIQYVSQPDVGPMPSMVAGPWILRALDGSRNRSGLSPAATFSISARSRRRY